MKVQILVATLLGIALGAPVASAQDQPQPQQLQVGRYQMLDASFTNAPDASMKQFKRLVILDTATGVLTTCDISFQDAGKAKDGHEYWAATPGCWPFATGQSQYVRKAPKGK